MVSLAHLPRIHRLQLAEAALCLDSPFMHVYDVVMHAGASAVWIARYFQVA